MGKRFVTIALMVLMLGSAPGTFAQRPLTIRLGVHGAVQGAPDVIAIRQGYFKQEHLEVDWRRSSVGREGRDAMIVSAIDINATPRDDAVLDRSGERCSLQGHLNSISRILPKPSTK